MTLFPVIRDWIAEFLLDIRDMTASEIGRNMLIEQVMFDYSGEICTQVRPGCTQVMSRSVQVIFELRDWIDLYVLDDDDDGVDVSDIDVHSDADSDSADDSSRLCTGVSTVSLPSEVRLLRQ